jgi:hypothetical protein
MRSYSAYKCVLLRVPLGDEVKHARRIIVPLSEPESGPSVKALRVGTEGVRRVVMDSEFDSSKGGEQEMLPDCADRNAEN